MAANYKGPSSQDEWNSNLRIRDARPLTVKFGSWLEKPPRLCYSFIFLAIMGVIFPLFTPLFFLLAIGLIIFANTRKPQLPLRLPMEAGKEVLDFGNVTPAGKPGKPEGIFFLGNVRDFNREGLPPDELWITNSDARTHFLVLGTTGSGKSEMLLSMSFNALSWGSGLIYIDGKADTSLKAKMRSLCRLVGRDVDFYLLNFMTGDSDVWEREASEDRSSNTMNVFVGGSSNSATQLVSSLMPESGGDNAMWQGLAVGMINAVIIGLYFMRWKDNKPIDAGILRDHIEMNKIIELAEHFSDSEKSGAPRDLVFKPLETYLLNLPGFDWKTNVINKRPVGEDTKKQHDFRSMQFLRQLTMLADTYGAIFKHQIPEVEMLDVVLNRRILVVMIPSLEKSEEESQGVGKLVVASLKLMMALTLGSKVEGKYADIIDSKPTNAPSPFPVILDELGYYFTKGLAVMFAQARSLGFAMVAAGQDIPAMSKGSNKEEAESVIANTKIKIGLAMEDPEKTGDLLIKTADKAIIAESGGYSGKVGLFSTSYDDTMNVTFQERNRLTLSELRALNSGEGVLMWQDKLIRYNTFYAFGSAKLTEGGRLNHLVKLQAPNWDKLEKISDKIFVKAKTKEQQIQDLLNINNNQNLEYKIPPNSLFEQYAINDLFNFAVETLDEILKDFNGNKNNSKVVEEQIFFMQLFNRYVANHQVQADGDEKKVDLDKYNIPNFLQSIRQSGDDSNALSLSGDVTDMFRYFDSIANDEIHPLLDIPTISSQSFNSILKTMLEKEDSMAETEFNSFVNSANEEIKDMFEFFEK